MLVQEFRRELHAFLERSGYSASALGMEVVHDARFIARLDREGADVKASTIDTFRAFMEKHDGTGA